jgi:acyl-CoA thioesterase I
MKRLIWSLSENRGLRRIVIATGWALLFGLGALPARSEPVSPSSCATPPTLLRSSDKLPHIAKKLHRGEPVKIIALGSSSTQGVGASSVAATYPSRFAAELQRMFPHSKVTVINKGIAGEDAKQMLVRFHRDVLDEHPDLLIWQTGTNSALYRNKVSSWAGRVTQGIDQAHAAGIDVMLMGPQFSPKFEAVPNHQEFLDHITTVASLRHVPVLRRYEIMKYWVASGEMTQAEMINSDGLHQTDRSYRCLGLAAAQMVAGMTQPPAQVAGSVAHKLP